MKSVAVLAVIVASASAFAPISRPFGVSVAVYAEAPAWAVPTDWKEKDFEAEIKKLEADAEQRLDTKITELMGNIEKTGKTN